MQKVISGTGSIKKVSDLAAKLHIRHPMIVGMEPLTCRLLRAAPSLLQSPVFSAFHSNPDLSDATAGADMYRKEGCDGLISIGGGSSIDTAKAIKALINVHSSEDAADNRFPDNMDTLHIAVPGTAGTGSEATQTAVVYIGGKKISLNHPGLLPEGVVLDASLLESLPLYHKKSCALDALSQGIESYWCASATDDSRVHAYLAILGVLDNLKDYLSGNVHAAEEMLNASYQSGKAILITRTTAAHAMSYELTKRFGLAHGHAVMITLPVLWEMAVKKEEMTPVLNELTRIMRLGNPLMVPKLLRGIMIDLEMSIPDIQQDEHILDDLTDSVNTERLNNHPVKLSRNELRETYRKAFTPLRAMEKQACLDIWRYYGSPVSF